MKQCSRCRVTKTLADFYARGKSRTGTTSWCKECTIEATKIRSKLKREQVLATKLIWREKNKDKISLYNAKYKNSNKEKIAVSSKVYREANPTQRRVYAARRRASIRNARVGWERELTKFVEFEAAHIAAIRTNLFGFTWEVDHTIPIAGKLVSGLHVWNNLQVIPMAVNRSKNNSFEVSI